MRAHQQDTVLRMALACLAADRTSPLTNDQRQWILALPGRTTPLTASERCRLRGPLLAWITAYIPSVAEIVERQFFAVNVETGE